MVLHVNGRTNNLNISEHLAHSSNERASPSPQASLDQFFSHAVQEQLNSQPNIRTTLLRQAELLKSAALVALSNSHSGQSLSQISKIQSAIGTALLKHREHPHLDVLSEITTALREMNENEIADVWHNEVVRNWGSELRSLLTANSTNFSNRLRQSIQNLLAQANPLGQSAYRMAQQGLSFLRGQSSLPFLQSSLYTFSALAYAGFRTSLSDWNHRFQHLHQEGLSAGLESLIYDEAPRHSEINFSLAERWMQVFREQEGENAFTTLQDQLRNSVDGYQVSESARRMSLLGGSAQDLLSTFLNQGGSLASSFLSSMLARRGVNAQGLLLSLLGGALIGTFQGAGNFALQWSNLREEERAEHLPRLLWEVTKSVGVGLGSAAGGYSFGCFMGGAAHQGFGALAHFWIADVGVEVVVQKLLEHFGQAQHWEEASLLQASWRGELAANAIEESVGNRHGAALQTTLQFSAMALTFGAATTLKAFSQPSSSPTRSGIQRNLTNSIDSIQAYIKTHQLQLSTLGVAASLGLHHFFGSSIGEISQANIIMDAMGFLLAGNTAAFVTALLNNKEELGKFYLELLEGNEEFVLVRALSIFAEVSTQLSENQVRMLANRLLILKNNKLYSKLIESSLPHSSAFLQELIKSETENTARVESKKKKFNLTLIDKRPENLRQSATPSADIDYGEHSPKSRVAIWDAIQRSKATDILFLGAGTGVDFPLQEIANANSSFNISFMDLNDFISSKLRKMFGSSSHSAEIILDDALGGKAFKMMEDLSDLVSKMIYQRSQRTLDIKTATLVLKNKLEEIKIKEDGDYPAWVKNCKPGQLIVSSAIANQLSGAIDSLLRRYLPEIYQNDSIQQILSKLSRQAYEYHLLCLRECIRRGAKIYFACENVDTRYLKECINGDTETTVKIYPTWTLRVINYTRPQTVSAIYIEDSTNP